MKTINSGGPMLASNQVITNFESIIYPVVASPKLDGWRCYSADGPRTRRGFLLPNSHTRALLMSEAWTGLDGELICGSPTDPNSMQKAQSAFSSELGIPDFTWYVFDDWRRASTSYWDCWQDRLRNTKNLPAFIQLLPQELVATPEELESFSKACTDSGYEGTIIRSPDSPYKCGRSTNKQGWMLKVKPYTYDEGVVVSLNEKMLNANELGLDNFGRAKRSSAKAGKVPAGTLGSFTIRTPEGAQFNIGCGSLDAEGKSDFWDNRLTLEGRIVTYKHFAQSGIRHKPRHGQFVAIRAKEDF